MANKWIHELGQEFRRPCSLSDWEWKIEICTIYINITTKNVVLCLYYMLYLCIGNAGGICNRFVISTFAVICNRIFHCHFYCLRSQLSLFHRLPFFSWCSWANISDHKFYLVWYFHLHCPIALTCTAEGTVLFCLPKLSKGIGLGLVFQCVTMNI